MLTRFLAKLNANPSLFLSHYNHNLQDPNHRLANGATANTWPGRIFMVCLVTLLMQGTFIIDSVEQHLSWKNTGFLLNITI